MIQQENTNESAITIPHSGSWFLFIEAEESRELFDLHFRYWLTTTATKGGLKCAITNIESDSERKYMLQIALHGSRFSVKQFFKQLQNKFISKKQRPKYKISEIFKYSGDEKIDYTHHLLCLIAELMNRNFMETSKEMNTLNLGSDSGTTLNNTRSTSRRHPRRGSYRHKQKRTPISKDSKNAY